MAAWPLILIYMEENTKDSCCLSGKCGCHKKWFRILVAVAIALIIFLVGVNVGAHFGYRGEGRSFNREGAAQCGGSIGSCPMMRGVNRGAAIKNSVPTIPATQVPQTPQTSPVAPATAPSVVQ